MRSPKSAKAGRVVRKKLADGSVKEYRYPAWAPAKASRIAPDSLDALLAAYRASPEYAAKAKATRANYAIYLRELDRLGSLPLKECTRKRILAVRDAIARARGNGAGTGFGRVAGAVFAWAVERGWLEYTPLARLKGLPGGHLQAWSEDAARTALERLPEAYRRVVVLALHTGQRRGDLIAMTWSAYDGATIRLRQQKTGTSLVIPAHPALRAELEEWKRERSATTILVAPRGQPWTAAHLSREMGRLLGELGLPDINVHGTRKLAATRLAEAGCSTSEIAAITGHRSLSMVELYTRSADQERLANSAVARLTTKIQPNNRKP